jgi:hypothetical protein
VITVNAGNTFVSCLTEDEEDTERLFNILNDFLYGNGPFAFEIMNDDGKAIVFDGIISTMTKERYAINFTVEPTSPVRIK